RQALAHARHARTPADTHVAIGLAVQQLGDRHSTFLGPEAVRRQQQQAAQGPKPHARRLEGGLGYLALPAHFPTGDQADPYAAIAGQLVAEVDQQGTCGWVVDLRGNEGGNMWPMLVGAGPILGEGEVGAFVYPEGRREVWAYRDGQALLDGQVRAQGPAYRLACPQPPVAVLTDGLTVSAGEAIAIAFRGRPKLRSFGEPTFGLPTANDLKVMSDGAWLLLTVARMADRTSQTYDGRIVPDEVVRASGTSGGADPVVQAAVAWLHDQPDCAR
ncbi:MAG TPA: S41 family peptidase, partial [Chloroflexota bacterium]|nr:S41 family peptidase [Chloroflexota bacterium]